MDILQYTFFQNALIGALLASILCGFVGTYIVTRRLVFISGGITHASFGGIGIAVFFCVEHPAMVIAKARTTIAGKKFLNGKCFNISFFFI